MPSQINPTTPLTPIAAPPTALASLARGRDQITESEVEYVEGRIGGDSAKADQELEDLVQRAVKEVTAWNAEMGKRVEFVIRELA